MKLCLNCLDYEFGEPEFCDNCGRKMVDWDLKCECGASIFPAFTLRYLPPWGKVSLYKHCPRCGRRIDERLMQEVKCLRRLYKLAYRGRTLS